MEMSICKTPLMLKASRFKAISCSSKEQCNISLRTRFESIFLQQQRKVPRLSLNYKRPNSYEVGSKLSDDEYEFIPAQCLKDWNQRNEKHWKMHWFSINLAAFKWLSSIFWFCLYLQILVSCEINTQLPSRSGNGTAILMYTHWLAVVPSDHQNEIVRWVSEPSNLQEKFFNSIFIF